MTHGLRTIRARADRSRQTIRQLREDLTRLKTYIEVLEAVATVSLPLSDHRVKRLARLRKTLP